MTDHLAALRLDPVLPAWMLLALAAAAALAVGVALVQRARGAVWRGLAATLLVAWLAGPMLVRETRRGLPDVALMIVDQTASMRIGDRARLAEQTRATLQDQLAGQPDLDLRTVVIPESGSEGTKLFAAIDRALADIPRERLAGIVAVTDGQVHDAPGGSTWGDAPFHALLTGHGEEIDRRIRIIDAPGFGIVGRSVVFRLAVDDLGVVNPAATARLTVRRDGEPPRTVDVPVGTPQTVEVPMTRAGSTITEFTAETLPGEISTVNNRAVVETNGVRDRLRVLLVSGEPHAGERTWRRLLKADPAVDLVHFTILRPPDKDDLTPVNELALIPFPVRELFQVKIRDFDLIILDRFQNRGILPATYLRNIANYVREGGALLMSVGPEFASPASLAATPLAELLPARPAEAAEGTGVAEGAFRPEITAIGARHPVTNALPDTATWGPWYRRIEAAGLRGDELMSADGAPLLILDRVGEGRVALLLSDQIWLWSRGHLGGGPQAELLRRVAHWLMKEPELEETALTATRDGGRITIERRSTAEHADGPVTLTDPDGARRTVQLEAGRPGQGRGSIPAENPGVWQVQDGTRTALVAIGAANPPELADLRATASVLGPVARASGGSVHWLGDGMPAVRRVEPDRASSGDTWIGLRRRHDHVVTGLAADALLPPWAALPIILGAVLLAWRQEGR